MRKNAIMRLLALCLAVMTVLPLALTGCADGKEKVLIYTSAEEYRIAHLREKLEEAFPDYDIDIVYKSSGDHAAKLLAEGTNTDIDITYDLEYAYLTQLDTKGYLASCEDYDTSLFAEDVILSKNYMPELRNGGAIIVNTEVLAEKKLAEPTSYEDLLDPKYEGLISMPNPKASGTGYMFLKALVNEWGEDEAFAYFEKLNKNVYQYTSSGSGPVNALVQGEAAIGLGMTAQAVTQINEGAPLKIIFFEEGSPFSLYGQAMVKGKDERECEKKVFDYMINTFAKENNEKFYPEKIYKDGAAKVENYPDVEKYSDMSNNTFEEKERLLEKWLY